MNEQYRVRVAKDYLVFSAAHFITYNGDVCERLHGHNYRVAAEVWGPLDANHYVIDFIAVRDALKSIVDELDHHMLLPTDHPLIGVRMDEREVEVKFRERRWVFPRGDCIVLPVPNTTAEMLSHYIGGRLSEAITERTGARPRRLRVEVDECFGQIAVGEFEEP
jgi:6-pyruvoyltetrahydropterin/6-carboxytetrahydropterin synthase